MINMTDNLYQFRNYILESLIERGYEYIARDKDAPIYAYSCKPVKKGQGWVLDTASEDGTYEDISLLSPMFTDIKWEDENPFKNPYTNWDSIPADTKVIVTGVDGSEWKCHFARKVSNNSILVYRDGKTSWTANDVVGNNSMLVYRDGKISWTSTDVVEVDINNVRLA